MADISRYRGGAMVRKPKVKQAARAGSNASALTARRVADTRAILDSPPSTEDDTSPVRRLNLTGGGGELNEELPLPYAADNRNQRRRQSPSMQVAPNTEAVVDGNSVGIKTHFKTGGAVRGKSMDLRGARRSNNFVDAGTGPSAEDLRSNGWKGNKLFAPPDDAPTEPSQIDLMRRKSGGAVRGKKNG